MQVLVDTTRQHAVKISVATLFVIIGSLWTVFVRPQMVFASDLEKVAKQTEMNTEVIYQIRAEQIDFRIDYFEDQIRVLESMRIEKPLNPTEAYCLNKYKDDLDKMKIKRSSIHGN